MKYFLTSLFLVALFVFSVSVFQEGNAETTKSDSQKPFTKTDILPLMQDGRIISPLNQSNLGVKPDQIICNENLVLIQKHDGSPSCVKPQTAAKLTENTSRGGWNPSQQLWEKLERQAYSVFGATSCPRYCVTLEPVDTMEKADEGTSLRVELPNYIPDGYDYFRFFAQENSLSVQISPEPFTGDTTWSEFYFLDHGIFLRYSSDSPVTIDGRVQAAYWAKNNNAQNISSEDNPPIYLKERELTYDENMRLLFLGYPSETHFNTNDDVYVRIAGYIPQEEIALIANSFFQNNEQNMQNNPALDTNIIKYSPVLFKGAGVDLEEEALTELLLEKQKQFDNAFDELGVKGLYPIVGESLSIDHNAYSLDEKYVGNPIALEIRILKDEFTKTNLEKINHMIRKYVGEEIDIVYSKGGYAVPTPMVAEKGK